MALCYKLRETVMQVTIPEKKENNVILGFVSALVSPRNWIQFWRGICLDVRSVMCQDGLCICGL